MKHFITVLLIISSLHVRSQTLSGIFGGDAAAVSYSISQTNNKWIKLGEITLNGNWSTFASAFNFYPTNGNHGDSRQQIICNIRNNGGTGIYGNEDINLITYSGQQLTIKDLKVIHTSGSGVTNNKLSIWVQMGSSYLSGVQFDVIYKKSSNATVTIQTTNQPYYESITETGTTYNTTFEYGLKGSTYEISGSTSGDAVFRIESDTDNNNESDNSRIEMYQDGGSLGAFIGFNADWPVSGGDAGNLFRIVTRYSNTNKYDAFVINGLNGNIGIGTTSPTNKLEVNGTIRSKEVKVEASPWPDFVFLPSYHLRSLKETELYIKENNHLPEMPSAEEVEEEDISLGEMNALLLKKIEELTLHLIEQNKRINTLEEKLAKENY